MKIFVVFYSGSHDIPEFIAAFSTYQKARDYVARCMSPAAYTIEDYDIDEHAGT